MTIRFTITGTVRQAENGIGVPGLFVKAYDKDLLFDDLLGTAITGTDGSFEIISEASDFREFFERRPDLYLRVFRADRKTEIWSSKEAVRWRGKATARLRTSEPPARITTPRPTVTTTEDA